MPRRIFKVALRGLRAVAILLAGCGLMVGAYWMAQWLHFDKAISRSRGLHAVVVACWLIVAGLPLFVANRRLWLKRRKMRRARQGHCPECGYNAQFGSHICPECGQSRILGPSDPGGCLTRASSLRQSALVLASIYFVICTGLQGSAHVTAFLWLRIVYPLEMMAKPLWYNRAFDSTIWKADDATKAKAGAWTPRACMLDDLISRRLLDGRTRIEVEDMLGPPTSGAPRQPGAFQYHIGAERGFLSLDEEWLLVSFDAEGRVAKVRVVTD